MEKKLSCIDCGVKNCNKMDKTYPEFCLTKNMNKEVFETAMPRYQEEDNHKVMVAAAEVECEHYCQYTRIEEIMAFAKKLEVKKIGIATCVGLLKESHTLAAILRNHGFEVFGVDVGIPEKCSKIGINMCNPILQAELLNEAGTELNIIMGLCVGHDSLFIKYSNALVTSGVTKDRVLGHNPAAALYTADTYYSKIK